MACYVKIMFKFVISRNENQELIQDRIMYMRILIFCFHIIRVILIETCHHGPSNYHIHCLSSIQLIMYVSDICHTSCQVIHYASHLVSKYVSLCHASRVKIICHIIWELNHVSHTVYK